MNVRHWTRVAPPSLRVAVRAALATAVLALLAACGGDGGPSGPGAPSPRDPAAGRFTLSSVNTRSLPFVLFDDSGFRLEFTAGTLALQADGNFVLAHTTVETVAGFPSTYQDTLRGTWSQNVGTVTLRPTDGGTAPATWDGRDLALDLEHEGQMLRTVYRKAAP